MCVLVQVHLRANCVSALRALRLRAPPGPSAVSLAVMERATSGWQHHTHQKRQRPHLSRCVHGAGQHLKEFNMHTPPLYKCSLYSGKPLLSCGRTPTPLMECLSGVCCEGLKR